MGKSIVQSVKGLEESNAHGVMGRDLKIAHHAVDAVVQIVSHALGQVVRHVPIAMDMVPTIGITNVVGVWETDMQIAPHVTAPV